MSKANGNRSALYCGWIRKPRAQWQQVCMGASETDARMMAENHRTPDTHEMMALPVGRGPDDRSLRDLPPAPAGLRWWRVNLRHTPFSAECKWGLALDGTRNRNVICAPDEDAAYALYVENLRTEATHFRTGTKGAANYDSMTQAAQMHWLDEHANQRPSDCEIIPEEVARERSKQIEQRDAEAAKLGLESKNKREVDALDLQREALEEQRRHNRQMEEIALGKGK